MNSFSDKLSPPERSYHECHDQIVLHSLLGFPRVDKFGVLERLRRLQDHFSELHELFFEFRLGPDQSGVGVHHGVGADALGGEMDVAAVEVGQQCDGEGFLASVRGADPCLFLFVNGVQFAFVPQHVSSVFGFLPEVVFRQKDDVGVFQSGDPSQGSDVLFEHLFDLFVFVCGGGVDADDDEVFVFQHHADERHLAGAAPVGVERHEDVLRRERKVYRSLRHEGVHLARFEQRGGVVGDGPHGFPLHEVALVLVEGSDHVQFGGGLPRWNEILVVGAGGSLVGGFALGADQRDADGSKKIFPGLVFEFEHFRVEVEFVLGGGDGDEGGGGHFQQRHDDFKEHLQVQKGGFLQVEDVSADPAQGFGARGVGEHFAPVERRVSLQDELLLVALDDAIRPGCLFDQVSDEFQQFLAGSASGGEDGLGGVGDTHGVGGDEHGDGGGFAEPSRGHAEDGLPQVPPVVDAHDFLHVDVRVVFVEVQADRLQKGFVKLPLHFGAFESELVQFFPNVHDAGVALVGPMHRFCRAVQPGHAHVQLLQFLVLVEFVGARQVASVRNGLHVAGTGRVVYTPGAPICFLMGINSDRFQNKCVYFSQ